MFNIPGDEIRTGNRHDEKAPPELDKIYFSLLTKNETDAEFLCEIALLICDAPLDFADMVMNLNIVRSEKENISPCFWPRLRN